MHWSLLLILLYYPIIVHSLTSRCTFLNTRIERNKCCCLHVKSLKQPIVTTLGNHEVSSSSLRVNDLTKIAINQRGTIECQNAIQQLNDICQQRLSYNFFHYNDNSDNNETKVSRILHLPNIIPTTVTEQIVQTVQCMITDGCISTNPDSVDGLPSYHLNLVSNGIPISAEQEDDNDNNDNCNKNNNEKDSFEKQIIKLRKYIEPYIYEKVLPAAKNALNNTNDLYVSDIFLRKYGEVITGKIRNTLSPHYDITSIATCVIALDNVAIHGRNGLYTTTSSSSDDDDDDDDENENTLKLQSKNGYYDGQSSNHVAHRRFFPLSCGDGIFHTWDILHGVDVEPGLDRTSLIVWFTSKDVLLQRQHTDNDDIDNNTGTSTSTSNDDLTDSQSSPYFSSPWILQECSKDRTNNNVAKFVLASAIESCTGSSIDPIENDQYSITDSSLTMVSPDSKVYYSGTSSSSSCSLNLPNPIQLYIDSALYGNTFAYNRLGSYFCDYYEDNISSSPLSDDLVQAAMNALPSIVSTELCDSIRQIFSLPNIQLSKKDDDDMDVSIIQRNRFIGKLFYLAGSLHGNPISQHNLVSEIMYDVDTIREIIEQEQALVAVEQEQQQKELQHIVNDAILLSATLCVLVSQHYLFGNNDPTHYSIDTLTRIVQTEIEFNHITTEEEFLVSSTVQISNLLLDYIR